MDYSQHNQQYSTTHTAQTSATATPRPGSPDLSSYNDNITPLPRANPFATPFASRPGSGPGSIRASASAVDLHQQNLTQKYFHSRRIKREEIEHPWRDRKDPREKWVTIIPIIGLVLGIALAGFLVYDGMRTVVNHTYCPVVDEDWSGGINSKIWTKEVEVGGYGYVLPQSAPKQQLTHRIVTDNLNKPQTPTRMYSSKTDNLSSNPPSRTKN